jgi:hypothetical protein
VLGKTVLMLPDPTARKGIETLGWLKNLLLKVCLHETQILCCVTEFVSLNQN